MRRPAGKSHADDRPIAVGLCRCSTESQDHSIADQEEAIQAWVAQAGVRLLRVFKDEGISGLRLDRPGLQGLLDFLGESKEKGTVVVWKRDRLIRPDEPVKGLLIEHRITELGWRLHYLAGQAPTGHPLVDAFMSLVEHHASGDYLRKLAQDSIRGILARLRAGEAPGGKVSYGYAKAVVDDRGTLLRTIPRTQKHRKAPGDHTRFVLGDPAEVATVRWLFQEYIRGDVSPAELARMLVDRGTPRPSAKASWSCSHVREMLVNPVYVGDVVWNKETSARCMRWLDGALSTRTVVHQSTRTGRVTGYARNDPKDHVVLRDRHPAIVSREVFARAQEVLRNRSGELGATSRSARVFALTGVTFCAECRDRLRGSSHFSRGKSYQYYACSGAKHKRLSTRRTVETCRLEEAVIRALIAHFEPAMRTQATQRKTERAIVARINADASPWIDAADEGQRILACMRALWTLLATTDRRHRRKVLLGLIARVEIRWKRRMPSRKRFELASATVTLRSSIPPASIQIRAEDLPARVTTRRRRAPG